MATIVRRTSQDGHVTFLVRVRRKGTVPPTATFSKLSEAKKWAQVTEGAILEGQYFQTSEAKKHTLTDVINRYIREVLPQKHPSTIPDQARQLYCWQTHLGHYLLADITPAVLGEYRSILTQERANATVVRSLAILSHAFTMAVHEWQWCTDNPVVSRLAHRHSHQALDHSGGTYQWYRGRQEPSTAQRHHQNPRWHQAREPRQTLGQMARQRTHLGGGLQNRLHAAPQALGHVVDACWWPSHPGPPRHLVKWRLE
jgi:hypothetical protein